MAQGVQIGKVAEQTGLSIDTIRFYQKIGLVKQPATPWALSHWWVFAAISQSWIWRLAWSRDTTKTHFDFIRAADGATVQKAFANKSERVSVLEALKTVEKYLANQREPDADNAGGPSDPRRTRKMLSRLWAVVSKLTISTSPIIKRDTYRSCWLPTECFSNLFRRDRPTQFFMQPMTALLPRISFSLRSWLLCRSQQRVWVTRPATSPIRSDSVQQRVWIVNGDLFTRVWNMNSYFKDIGIAITTLVKR